MAIMGESRPLCPLQWGRFSWHQDCGALKVAGTQVGQGLIGLVEPVFSDRRGNPHVGDLPEELEAILPGEVGDGDELPLAPEQTVWKTGNVAHMNSRTDHPAALANSLQRQRDEMAQRRVDDGRVEGPRGRLFRASGPGHA